MNKNTSGLSWVKRYNNKGLPIAGFALIFMWTTITAILVFNVLFTEIALSNIDAASTHSNGWYVLLPWLVVSIYTGYKITASNLILLRERRWVWISIVIASILGCFNGFLITLQNSLEKSTVGTVLVFEDYRYLREQMTLTRQDDSIDKSIWLNQDGTIKNEMKAQWCEKNLPLVDMFTNNTQRAGRESKDLAGILSMAAYNEVYGNGCITAEQWVNKSTHVYQMITENPGSQNLIFKRLAWLPIYRNLNNAQEYSVQSSIPSPAKLCYNMARLKNYATQTRVETSQKTMSLCAKDFSSGQLVKISDIATIQEKIDSW